MKIRLKDKTWKCCTITIERIVEQYKTDGMTENVTKKHCVYIRTPTNGVTSACFANPVQMYSFIMREANL